MFETLITLNGRCGYSKHTAILIPQDTTKKEGWAFIESTVRIIMRQNKFEKCENEAINELDNQGFDRNYMVYRFYYDSEVHAELWFDYTALWYDMD